MLNFIKRSVYKPSLKALKDNDFICTCRFYKVYLLNNLITLKLPRHFNKLADKYKMMAFNVYFMTRDIGVAVIN